MNPTYDRRTIVLHWLTAILVLLLWVAGQTIDWFPRGTPRITARSLHIAVGVLLGVVLVLRLYWRATGGAKLPPASPGLAGAAAKGMHWLLYALLAFMVLLGLALVWFRGDTIFNLFTVPKFDPNSRELAHAAGDLHGLVANLLLIMAGLHAAAAIAHRWMGNRAVLRRMWPGLPDTPA